MEKKLQKLLLGAWINLENFNKGILSAILQAIPYIGLGSGTKLGLGNVKTFYN